MEKHLTFNEPVLDDWLLYLKKLSVFRGYHEKMKCLLDMNGPVHLLMQDECTPECHGRLLQDVSGLPLMMNHFK
jgi:hypothetical protein